MNTNPTEQLSTVALVKSEIGGGITNSANDAEIEEYIGDLSQYWLQRCGVFSLSTLYTETELANGTGTAVLPLRHYATSITNVQIVYQAGNDGIPGDIQRAFTRHCALEYKRKDTLNMRSQAAMGGNVALLNDVETTPDIEHVIKMHSRLGM